MLEIEDPALVATSRADHLVVPRRRVLLPPVSLVLTYVVLIVVAFLFLLPLLWLLSTALKEAGVVRLYPPVLIPAEPRWDNFVRAWTQRPMALYFRNTLTIAIPCVIGQVVVNSIVGYGFAVLRAPGKNLLFSLTLAMLMIPTTVTLIPTYLLFSKLGWTNTYLPFIVPAFLGSPFYIFLLRQFFLGVPGELREAALVDGAGELRILFQIFIPLSVPVLVTVAMFSFMFYWNDWFGPLIYLNEASLSTLAIGLIRFVDVRDQTPWELLMAASAVMLLPILVVFVVGQRFFVRGIAFSGLRG